MGERAVAGAAGVRPGVSPAAAVAWGVLGAGLAALVGGAALPLPAGAPPRLWVVGAAAALALAALAAAWTLERRLGPLAPLWIVAWIFGSAAFASPFRAPADALRLAAVALGLALVYGGEARRAGRLAEIYDGGEGAGTPRLALRWTAAGALLGGVAVAHPLYLGLALPALLAAPRQRRRLARLALVAGAAAALVAGLALTAAAGWRLDPTAVRLEPALHGWNLLYLAAGRHAGLLVLYLPLVLGFLVAGGERGRRALPLAVVVALLAWVVLDPFDWADGSGLGSRAFLALYPALWFVAARPGGWAPPLVVVALAAPCLWPLWLAPRSPTAAARLSPLAERFLPFETTLREVPVRGEIRHGASRLRVVGGDAGVAAGGRRLWLRGGASGHFLVVTAAPLATAFLEFEAQATPRLEVRGAEPEETILRPDGGVAFALTLPAPRAVHSTWWSREPQRHYPLTLRLEGAPPEPIGFTIDVAPRPAAAGAP